jgi:hypothetical protein
MHNSKTSIVNGQHKTKNFEQVIFSNRYFVFGIGLPAICHTDRDFRVHFLPENKILCRYDLSCHTEIANVLGNNTKIILAIVLCHIVPHVLFPRAWSGRMNIGTHVECVNSF